MTGVLKVRTSTAPDVWTPINGGFINMPAAAKSGYAMGPDNAGPTSGTNDLLVKTITVPAPGLSGKLHVWGGMSISKSLNTERFQSSIRVDGVATGWDYGSNPSVSIINLRPHCVVDISGATDVILIMTLANSAGSTTATVYAGSPCWLQWIFIPTGDGGITDYGSLDTRFVNLAGDTMTGPLTTTTLQANYINVPGGAVDAALLRSGLPPTAASDVTRKDYVDVLAQDVIPATARWVSVGGADNATVITNGWAYFLPVCCPACTIDGLGCEVTVAGAAGAVIRLGIYANHATRIEPSTRMIDAGTVSSTTTGWKSLAITPTVHNGGWMWLALAPQTAGCTIRAVTGHGEPWIMFGTGPQVPPGLGYRSWTSPSFGGAFPATITDLGLASQLDPKIAFKTSA